MRWGLRRAAGLAAGEQAALCRLSLAVLGLPLLDARLRAEAVFEEQECAAQPY